MTLKTTKDDADTNADKAFHLEQYLPHQIMITARRVSRMMTDRYATEFNLSVAELSVLSAVGRNGSLSPTAIAEQTSMDKVRVSRASASLVAQGMLRQSRDPSDGRGRLLRLTKRGTGIHNGVVPVVRDAEAELIAGLGKTELAALTRALNKLSARLDTIEQGIADEA